MAFQRGRHPGHNRMKKEKFEEVSRALKENGGTFI